MKVFFAVFLLFFVSNGIECDSAGQSKGYVMRDYLNELDTHFMYNCGNNETNGEPVRAFMGPCMDTPTCQCPACCGIIAGRDSVFIIEYKAKLPLVNGNFNGNCGGIGLGTAVQGSKNFISIELPFQFLVPELVGGYKRPLSGQTTLPQEAGGVYNLTVPFRFVTTVLTTFGIKACFVAEIVDDRDKQALCWGVWGELVNPDFIPSVETTVETVVEDPLWALGNLGDKKVLGGPLVGLIGNNPNKNPFPGQ